MARYDPDNHHRRSIRLSGYDYSQAGAYFVTLCTRGHEMLLGCVVEEDVVLSPIGSAVDETWRWLAEHYAYVDTDVYVVMPNHLHAILWITPAERPGPVARKPLGRLIGAFKTVSTGHANKIRNAPGVQLWQRNYYEHVIRNERALEAIRQYIVDNPARWYWDRYNPEATGPDDQARELWNQLQGKT